MIQKNKNVRESIKQRSWIKQSVVFAFDYANEPLKTRKQRE